MADPKNTDNQLTQLELERQKKQYNLVLEALFEDEVDTKSLKLWVIISACAGIAGFLVAVIALFKK